MKRQTTPVELNHIITGATLVSLVDGTSMEPYVSGSDASASNVSSPAAAPIHFVKQFELKQSDMCGVLRKV